MRSRESIWDAFLSSSDQSATAYQKALADSNASDESEADD